MSLWFEDYANSSRVNLSPIFEYSLHQSLGSDSVLQSEQNPEEQLFSPVLSDPFRFSRTLSAFTFFRPPKNILSHRNSRLSLYSTLTGHYAVSKLETQVISASSRLAAIAKTTRLCQHPQARFFLSSEGRGMYGMFFGTGKLLLHLTLSVSTRPFSIVSQLVYTQLESSRISVSFYSSELCEKMVTHKPVSRSM